MGMPGGHIDHTRHGNSIDRALRLAIFLLVLGVASPARAGVDGSGGTRSVFSLGAGARGIALGRAFVSLTDDPGALYWNPACLRDVQDKQIMATYFPLYSGFADASYTFLGAAYPTLRAGALGMGFMRVATTFQGYDASSRPTGEGNYSESQVVIAYAFERSSPFLLGRLATGVSFKIVNQKLSPYSSTAPGLDIGFRLIPHFASSLVLAVNFQDIYGARHKLNLATDRTYRTILAGVGYRRSFHNGAALRFMLQVDAPEEAPRSFHAGVEVAPTRYFVLRLGIDDGVFAFGLGFQVSAFGLDYAFLSRDETGSSHPVSFTTHYGNTIYEQKRIRAEMRRQEEAQLIKRAFFQRVEAHRNKALAYEQEGDLAMSLDQWKIVLEYVPGDSQATARMEEIRGKLLAEQEKASRDREKQAVISSHFSQGLKFYSENDYARARDQWMAILEIDPHHEKAKEYMVRTQRKIDALVGSHKAKAHSYEREGRLTEAMGEWSNVKILAPEDPEVDGAMDRIKAKIEAMNKDFEQAARKLKVVGLYNEALTSFDRGAYQEALHRLEQLLRLDPTHREAKNLKTMVERKLKPLTKEEEEKIRRLYLKGMQYFSKDMYAEAIAEWEKILAIDPTNESVKRNIREAKQRIEQLQEQR